MSKLIGFLTVVVILFSSSCTDPIQDLPAFYGDLEVAIDRKVASFDGVINADALQQLKNALNDYSSISTINIDAAEGNTDRTAALEMGTLLRDREINTNITENGTVKQDGLYFFLGGLGRTIDSGGRIGVSSWSSNGMEASTLEQDDPVHLPYIEYLESIGFSEEKAHNLYFFTLSAAASNDNHWMSAEEISQFGLAN